MLTGARSQTLTPENIEAFGKLISSRASAVGLSLSVLLDGQEIAKSGLPHSPANPLAPRAKGKGKPIVATFGRPDLEYSQSAALQRSLESKLQARMAAHGSPEYVLTWKHWDMKSGPRICALRASRRRTSGNGFFGWPTAAARDWKDTGDLSKSLTRKDGRSRLGSLPRLAYHVQGWPTCRATDADGRKVNASLKGQAALIGAMNGLEAPKGKRAEYNPQFPCWLMGFPQEWLSFAE